ncbi:hypothetical protein J437_LFUL001968 [Ladona fulva]|uniref:Uncharacterized protein n=1 Tax=Ladona fulva TaxID=123851 RepID=A0A8K0NXK1_LADFU|nr:hypothetical protein J437_LFUL001968 [Ladona fulva]
MLRSNAETDHASTRLWFAMEDLTAPGLGQTKTGVVTFSCSATEHRCECRDIAINCTGLGLKSLPMDIEEQMTKYYMANNYLNYTLDEETFSKLHRLSYLDLSNNSLTHIPPLAFKNLWRLLMLSLKDNHIKNLLNSTFYGLPSLRTL